MSDLTPEQAADELAAVSQEPGHGEQTDRPGINVMGDVDPADIRHDEQPAPAARETAADELAEAEWLVRRRSKTMNGTFELKAALVRVMAEYDERGRERDAARAEVVLDALARAHGGGRPS